MKRWLFCLVALSACSSSTPGATPSSGGNGGNGSCTPPKVSSTDGSTACEPMCNAGEHCSTSGVTCINGCLSEANCPSGQFCDLSAGTTDLEMRPTGVCRTPTPCPTPSSNPGGGPTVSACFSGLGTSTDACNQASQCLLSACDMSFKGCFGNNYASGVIDGVCKDWLGCVSQSGCTAQAAQQCAASGACASCLETAQGCVQSSCPAEKSACLGSLGPGDAGTTPPPIDAGASCAALATCCQAIMDAAQQMACASAASSGDDSVCGMQLTFYRAQNACP